MAWTLLLPPGYEGASLDAFYNFSDSQIIAGSYPQVTTGSYFFSSKKEGNEYLNVPNLNELNILLYAYLPKYTGTWIEVESENHSLIIDTKTADKTFRVGSDTIKEIGYFDLEKDGNDRKFIFTIKTGAELTVMRNREQIYSVQHNFFDGEPIKRVRFTNPYTYAMRWAILSSEKIPLSTVVRRVETPVIETDWEADEKGKCYTTSEAGKFIKIKLPEGEIPAGKKLLCSVPVLYNCTGGGTVNKINMKVNDVDVDYGINDKRRSVGFLAGDTIFTSKE